MGGSSTHRVPLPPHRIDIRRLVDANAASPHKKDVTGKFLINYDVYYIILL